MARWYASQGEHTEVIQQIGILRQFSPTLARKKVCRLVEYNSLIALGRINECVDKIQAALPYNQRDPDFYIALNNCLANDQNKDPTCQVTERLNVINQVFRDEGLAEVYLPQGLDLRLENFNVDAPAISPPRAEKISVLMAAYNAEEHLCMAAGSILAQTWTNLELIIVDDASPTEHGMLFRVLQQRTSESALFGMK